MLLGVKPIELYTNLISVKRASCPISHSILIRHRIDEIILARVMYYDLMIIILMYRDLFK